MSAGDLGLARVRRALFSVHDKSGVVDLATTVHAAGAEIVATGSTRAALAKGGVPATSAEELTGIGSWFGGRIKTLHPGILGGILASRTPEGEAELKERGLLPIDLVVVNLYPFIDHERERPNAPDREEFIDIGGVTLIRAAAKNHAFVGVASDVSDYAEVAHDLTAHAGQLSLGLRRELARRGFSRCGSYDLAIAEALASGIPEPFPRNLLFQLDAMPLRYGENPHQAAAVYQLGTPGSAPMNPLALQLLKGSGLSYTNLLDLDAALTIVSEFSAPTAAVVKHATPCGVASATTLHDAVAGAVATDPVARYGCVVATNRPVEGDVPGALHGVFVDLLAAPEIVPDARAHLDQRPKIKLVRAQVPLPRTPRWELQGATGRLLVQDSDQRQLAPEDFRCVTTRPASPQEAGAMDFAWRVVRHAKSNAIVLTQGSCTVGIGSGVTSRVQAVKLALGVAGGRATGSVLASDGFFPFPDGVEAAGRAGVSVIIQPGGSIRDAEVIAMAEKYGISMYLTGWRVFRH